MTGPRNVLYVTARFRASNEMAIAEPISRIIDGDIAAWEGNPSVGQTRDLDHMAAEYARRSRERPEIVRRQR